jgi:topoisomerase-4 subunit A
MAENEEDNIERDEEFEEQPIGESEEMDDVIPVSGMYKNWFLDYASYVILERAVPGLADGLKPVQRRILHSLKEMDDGRYNKVANVIGNTMKYHPHGDASIGDAMVQIGQKDLMIDCQGNWGNILTGDRAAAPRYIESRLTKFALEVGFNSKTTNWLSSYDGRNREPENLPVKFPLLLAQGGEGIAVGLACKMLPHNFNELIASSIKVLKGRKTDIMPDFPTGGMADFTLYNNGLRGGKIRVRARIKQEDKKTLIITEIPFSTTTSSLIESVIKANDKGKIKVKKIEDNTAAEVEILVHLHPGVSPDKMIDALYAFTDCEISISPNACVIEDDKPQFLGVNELLKRSTERTVDLLKLELEIKLNELQEQWHFSSLERIFIEKKIYVELHGLGYDEAIELTHKLLKPHIKKLIRKVTDDDVKKLLEIRMRRITRHDSDKADELLVRLEADIKQTKDYLANLIDFAIEYFKELKRKYGKGKDRKTEIKQFDNIVASKVAVANTKLYVDRTEGFIGYGLRKSDSEFVAECSDIDSIIIIREDGTLIVSKIAAKNFVGKNILHVAVWKKKDERTIYNLIYRDGGTSGKTYMKRFAVTSITRDKEYHLGKGTAGSKVLYLSANPNGEAETIQVVLRSKPSLKKLKLDLDFSELAIKGRGAGGNILTKHAVNKIIMKDAGVSTLGARKVWFDDTVQRLNSEGRGQLLGDFKAEDKILTVYQSGEFRISGFGLSTRFDEDLILMEKWNPKKPLSAVYLDGDKKQYYIKRFLVEGADKKTLFITEHDNSILETLSTDWKPQFQINFSKVKGKEKKSEIINVEDFISIKGIKALGNKLTNHKVKSIDILEPLPYEESQEQGLPKANNALSEELKNVPVDDQIKTTKKVVPIMASKKPDPVELITPIADSPSQEVEFEIDTTNLDKPADNSKKKGEPITPSDEEDEGQLGLF